MTLDGDCCDLVLASRSPRRRRLLDQIGLRYVAVAVDVDEMPEPGEAPAAMVERLARAKAIAGHATSDRDVPVLGADTTVAADGAVLGKPADAAEALAVLAHLCGRSHQVYSGVAVATGSGTDSRVAVSTVWLRPTSEAERRAYWASGEPAGKAGAYAIQGLGAVLVERLEGSYSNVVGLPLFETAGLLAGAGIEPLARYRR